MAEATAMITFRSKLQFFSDFCDIIASFFDVLINELKINATNIAN